MEMYSVVGMLALLGPMVAFLLILLNVPVVTYGFFTGRRRRGIIAGRIALVISILAVLMSALMWYELLTGRYPDGTLVNYSDPDFVPYEVIGGLQALVLLFSILCVASKRVLRGT